MVEPHDCADGAEPLHIAGLNLYSLWDCGSQQWVQWIGTGQCLQVHGNGSVFEGGPFDLFLEGVDVFLVSRSSPEDDRFIHCLSGAFEYDLQLRRRTRGASPEWGLVRNADPSIGVCFWMDEFRARIEPVAIQLQGTDTAFEGEWYRRPCGVFHDDLQAVLTYTCALPWVLGSLNKTFDGDYICRGIKRWRNMFEKLGLSPNHFTESKKSDLQPRWDSEQQRYTTNDNCSGSPNEFAVTLPGLIALLIHFDKHKKYLTSLGTDGDFDNSGRAAKLSAVLIGHSALVGEWNFGVQPDGQGERLYFQGLNLDWEKLADSEKNLRVRSGQRFVGSVRVKRLFI